MQKKSGQIDVFKLMWSARHLRIQWNELRERIYRIHHSNNLNEKMKIKTSIKWYKNVTFPTDVQYNWIVVHQRIWINFNVFFFAFYVLSYFTTLLLKNAKQYTFRAKTSHENIVQKMNRIILPERQAKLHSTWQTDNSICKQFHRFFHAHHLLVRIF